MIVVDASAIVAIVEKEADARGFAAALADTDQAIMSPVSAVETGMVLIGRGHFAGPEDLDVWLTEAGVTVSGADIHHADVLAAFLRFGKGRHRARLNLGACFAYALAQRLDLPLLYKGDEFALTDVRSALQPT